MTDLTTPIVVDGHLDIAWNYFNNRRDFRQSAWVRRRQESDPVFLQRYGRSMVGLPELLVGRGSSSLRLDLRDACLEQDVSGRAGRLRDSRRSPSLGQQQLAYYQRLAEEEPRLRLILTQADLDAVLDTWRDGSDVTEHRLGLMIGMEGADPILEPAQLEEWYAEGLRIVGPAWTQTRYSGGTKAPGPLTDLGRALLEAMAELQMVLDLAHMAPEACLEALDRYDGPLFASHANPLRFRPDRPDRNLSDDLIRRIAERDGAVGIMPYNLFLLPDWRPATAKMPLPWSR
ncbi:MAG: peptidase [Anaerolineae bacterium]|nr:MAG: peptidase [Anaerolineae bacterium]